MKDCQDHVQLDYALSPLLDRSEERRVAVDQKIQQLLRRGQYGDQWFIFHGISAQIASKSIKMINYMN